MTTKKLTKLLALYLPYILLGLATTNFGEAWRLAEGKELGDKIMSMTAIVMYDIPGVVFDQPLNIPAAFLCIGVWAAASAVLANVALVRRK